MVLRTLCLNLALMGFSAFPCLAAELTLAGPLRISPADLQASSPPTTEIPSQVPVSATPAEHGAANELLSEARGFYRKGDFDQAIEKYLQVLHEWPSSSEAYAGLTRAYLKKKDVQQSDATVAAGLKIADSPRLHVASGEAYLREGRTAEAEQEWVGVINSGHQDARACLGLARVRWALSAYRSGWTLIDRAYLLDPTSPEISRLWVERLSRAEGIKYLEEHLAAESNDRGIGRIDTGQRCAFANQIDQRRRDSFLQRFGFMRRPFELAVAFARRREDRDLAHARRKAGFVAQVVIHRPRMFGIFWRVQLDAARSFEAADRPRAAFDNAVVRGLDFGIEFLALGQRQAAARFRIDIARIAHSTLLPLL